MQLIDLQNKIDRYAQAYYRGIAMVEDAVYDQLLDELRSANPSDHRLTRVGVPYSADEIRTKSKHSIPMGSLEKTNGGIDGAGDWILKINSKLGKSVPLVITKKYDGNSIEVIYKNGKLDKGTTRGDGWVGEDITSNVAMWNNLPMNIQYEGDLSIRGEAFLLHEDFNTVNSIENIADEAISNPRNVGSGIIGRKDGKHNNYITFMPFDVYGDKLSEATYSNKLDFLKSLGFEIPDYVIVHTPAQVAKEYVNTLNDRTSLEFDIDGMVLTVNDQAYREELDKDNDDKLHPKYSTAIKFPFFTSQATVTGCAVTAGHNGSLNPTITVKTVRVGGVDVSNVLLNNWSTTSEYPSAASVAVGDTIEIGLAGDIIPKVLRIIKQPANRKPLHEPSECPFCGTKTTRNLRGKSGAATYCGQYDECPEAKFEKIANWFNKLNILGIGETMRKCLIAESHIKSPPDIFKLTVDTVAAIHTGKTTIGEKRAAKIVKEINDKKTMPLNVFLGCIGIPLLGRRRAEIIIKAADGRLDSLENWLDTAKLDSVLASLPGIGEAIQRSIVDGIEKNSALIAEFLSNGVQIERPKMKTVPQGGVSLAGVSLCFTGTRDLLEEAVAAGAEIKSGVSKNLTYLVQADPLSQTTKSKKADELGIKVIGIEYLRQVLAGTAKLD